MSCNNRGMTWRRSILILLLSAISGPALGTHQAALAEGPNWVKRKKAIIQEKKDEAEDKAAEKPVVGGNSPNGADASTTSSQLSVDNRPPPSTKMFLSNEGFTESFTFNYGKLSQADVPGKALSGRYSAGWWVTPSFVVMGSGQALTIYTGTFMYLMAGVVAEVRYFPNQHLAVSFSPLYAVSVGLTRVGQANIPPPPTQTALAQRLGPLFEWQATYLFWPRRTFALGPALSFMTGKQGERSLTMISLSLTIQTGRPNYSGSVTESW